MAKNVNIKYNVKTAQAEKGMKRLTGFVNKNKIAFLAAAAAITVMIKKVADAGDAWDKMSLRLGMSVEFLSSMELAVVKAGSSMAEFENGMKRLARNISDANEGLSTSVRAFERLGVTYKNTDGTLRDTKEIFFEIVDAMGKLRSETARAATAQELFGRGGVQLLPLIKAGTAAIAEQIERSKELGLVWSADQATQAAKFNDQITELKFAFSGFVRVLLVDVLPALTDVALIITEIISGIGEMVSGLSFERELKRLQAQIIAEQAGGMKAGGALFEERRAERIEELIKLMQEQAFRKELTTAVFGAEHPLSVALKKQIPPAPRFAPSLPELAFPGLVGGAREDILAEAGKGMQEYAKGLREQAEGLRIVTDLTIPFVEALKFDLANGINQTLHEIISGTATFKSAMTNIWRSLLAELLAQTSISIAGAAVGAVPFGKIFGAIGGMFGGGGLMQKADTSGADMALLVDDFYGLQA